MGQADTNVIPFPCLRAPFCTRCGIRMELLKCQSDPNGGQYMYEMFGCPACSERRMNVRPMRQATSPRVYEFARLRRYRPTG
jgi:hypothetical protein